ncbi:NADH:flavin oxidoreductase [uncultured Mitsuokella sp.]|uniref:NADH:flavin oxidoreductase n=1 Tax=uncultured Mitsuokella sp. TaxID=453120 RepID=UPI00261DC815|nr:NADH:flavin oxidoreductase [uncultured Mitsuokella sp.]
MSNMIERPLELPHLTLKNRVIRSAVHSFLAGRDGYMTEAEYKMYEALAANHIGTIITGHCCVDPRGRANIEQVNLYDDCFIPQFRRAIETAHAQDARFIVQINHAGPRAIDNDDLADVVARPLKKERTARALTKAEIKDIEAHFIAAARRAQQAGADGVQLHAAHSYLLSRFIDPTFNQRTDEYGGDIEGRFRMTEEIIRGIHEACGPDFPVLIKINIDTKHEDARGYHDDMVWLLHRVHALGVTLVEFSGVDFINLPHDATLYYLEEAVRLKQEVPEVPLSLVGGVRSLADMEKVMASDIGCVSLGRSLIAEPDFVTKELSGGGKSICLSCSRCFVLPHMHPGVRCVWAWKKIRAAQKAAKTGK